MPIASTWRGMRHRAPYLVQWRQRRRTIGRLQVVSAGAAGERVLSLLLVQRRAVFGAGGGCTAAREVMQRRNGRREGEMSRCAGAASQHTCSHGGSTRL